VSPCHHRRPPLKRGAQRRRCRRERIANFVQAQRASAWPSDASVYLQCEDGGEEARHGFALVAQLRELPRTGGQFDGAFELRPHTVGMRHLPRRMKTKASLYIAPANRRLGGICSASAIGAILNS
jgi:hypothetical protein